MTQQHAHKSYGIYKVYRLWILSLLVGCSNPPIKQTRYNLEPKIKIVFTEPHGDIGGWARVGDVCILYIPDLRHVFDWQRMCIAGHELFHCVFGIYHDKGVKSCG